MMRTSRTRGQLAVGALLSVFAAGCDGDLAAPKPSPPSISPSTVASDEVGCGLADEDLVVKAIGTDVVASGTGILPPDQAVFRAMDCDIRNVTDPHTSISIAALLTPRRKIQAGKRSWPTSVGQMDCPGAWLAPRRDHVYAAACLDDNAPPGARATTLRQLSGRYVIAVSIVRPKPRPDDAETAFRISQDVATKLP